MQILGLHAALCRPRCLNKVVLNSFKMQTLYKTLYLKKVVLNSFKMQAKTLFFLNIICIPGFRESFMCEELGGIAFSNSSLFQALKVLVKAHVKTCVCKVKAGLFQMLVGAAHCGFAEAAAEVFVEELCVERLVRPFFA